MFCSRVIQWRVSQRGCESLRECNNPLQTRGAGGEGWGGRARWHTSGVAVRCRCTPGVHPAQHLFSVIVKLANVLMNLYSEINRTRSRVACCMSWSQCLSRSLRRCGATFSLRGLRSCVSDAVFPLNESECRQTAIATCTCSRSITLVKFHLARRKSLKILF